MIRRLPYVALVLAALAGCDTNPPPPPADTPSPAVADTTPAVAAPDTLRGDSLMARDTLGGPE